MVSQDMLRTVKAMNSIPTILVVGGVIKPHGPQAFVLGSPEQGSTLETLSEKHPRILMG